jgi:arginyl-tRNA synthetase
MALFRNPFAAAATRAVAEALELNEDLFQASAPPKPELGDYAVGCFPAARALKAAPPKLAAQVVERFEPNDFLIEAKATGPFVNFRANRASLYSYLLKQTIGDGEGLIPRDIGTDKTICIDYSSPNISKELAYHHIRSTVIGHALVEIYRSLGYRVIGINHLGDWGTTHGMLLAAQEMWGIPDPLTITGLNDLYKRFREAMKSDESLAEKGRAWFKRLEDGDPEARELWQRFKDVSWAEFEEVYETLGIEFEEVRGESDYLDAMQPVLDLLDDKGLSEISEGALVVPLGDDIPPLLLRKQDGATLYGTRDLAAAMYRWDNYHFERNLYVVDRGQGLHFKQLFMTLAKAGKEWADRCAHVSFGLVRMGGKKTTTRGGNVVLLKEVLGEAQERARAKVSEANPDLDAEVLAETSRMVGVGAVVFFNLSAQRDKDVDFEWGNVLSTEGESGPYIQYTHARCCSVLEKAPENEASLDVDLSKLANEYEWAVAQKLLDIGTAVHRAADSNEPHVVSRYLLDLCALFNRWYSAGNNDASLRFLVDDEPTRRARLALIAAMREVLHEGLALLGIEAPNAM